MEPQTLEEQKTKQGVLYDFATVVYNCKHSFVIYNTLINRFMHTYGKSLDINVLTDPERLQLGETLANIQFNLLNAQIYYSSICKKKKIDDKTIKILVDKIDNVLKEYVPNRPDLKEVVSLLNDFLINDLSADFESDSNAVQGILSNQGVKVK